MGYENVKITFSLLRVENDQYVFSLPESYAFNLITTRKLTDVYVAGLYYSSR